MISLYNQFFSRENILVTQPKGTSHVSSMNFNLLFLPLKLFSLTCSMEGSYLRLMALKLASYPDDLSSVATSLYPFGSKMLSLF